MVVDPGQRARMQQINAHKPPDSMPGNSEWMRQVMLSGPKMPGSPSG